MVRSPPPPHELCHLVPPSPRYYDRPEPTSMAERHARMQEECDLVAGRLASNTGFIDLGVSSGAARDPLMPAPLAVVGSLCPVVGPGTTARPEACVEGEWLRTVPWEWLRTDPWEWLRTVPWEWLRTVPWEWLALFLLPPARLPFLQSW